MIHRGGKNIYGVPLGILMLESRFPRILGDAGNAATFPFPVAYRVVHGADPERVVRRPSEAQLLPGFIEAALELEAAGVDLLSTNCGFLVLFQAAIQSRLRIPFLSSALLDVRRVAAGLPEGKSVGILTIDSRALTERHMKAAAMADIPYTVVGMEEAGGYFMDTILGNREELDEDRCRAEHVRAAGLLRERDANLGAIVLECTNMPPYAAAIRETSGLPVYDFTTYVGEAVSALPL